MARIAALFVVLAFIVTSCGYKVAGYNPEKPVKFYIERVENNTQYPDFSDEAQFVADRFFIKYGEMASYKDATFFLQIRLEKVRFETSITSATDEAVSTDIDQEIQIVVTDVNGVEVFTGTYKPSASFGVTPQVYKSLTNRRKAIRENMETALEDFRDAFSSKMQ